MEKYDFSNFPNLADETKLESYNPSRYADRFDKEDFSRMSLKELQETRKKIEKNIRDLEGENEEEEKWDKPSYVIKERIRYAHKMLHKIDTAIAKIHNAKADEEHEKELQEKIKGSSSKKENDKTENDKEKEDDVDDMIDDIEHYNVN